MTLATDILPILCHTYTHAAEDETDVADDANFSMPASPDLRRADAC
jgi:hypothetical protein